MVFYAYVSAPRFSQIKNSQLWHLTPENWHFSWLLTLDSETFCNYWPKQIFEHWHLSFWQMSSVKKRSFVSSVNKSKSAFIYFHFVFIHWNLNLKRQLTCQYVFLVFGFSHFDDKLSAQRYLVKETKSTEVHVKCLECFKKYDESFRSSVNFEMASPWTSLMKISQENTAISIANRPALFQDCVIILWVAVKYFTDKTIFIVFFPLFSIKNAKFLEISIETSAWNLCIKDRKISRLN